MATWTSLDSGKPIGSDAAEITVITDRIDNIEAGLLGTDELDALALTGGTADGLTIAGGSTINASVIGGATPAAITGTTVTGSTVTDGVASLNAGALSGLASIAVTGTVDVTGDLDVDNINLNGNTVTTTGAATVVTTSNGDINLTPHGTGEVNNGIFSSVTQNRCHVTNTIDQNSKGNGTPYAITWDTEVYDVGDMHLAGSSSRLTAAIDGTYLITGQIEFGGGTTTSKKSLIYLNGSEAAQNADTGSSSYPLQVSYIARMSATDYVELFMDTTGTAANIIATRSFFQIVRLH